MADTLFHRAVAGASLMRPRTIVDLYDRLRKLSAKSEAEKERVRERIDQVERSLTARVDDVAATVRTDIDRLNHSLTDELRGLVVAVREGDADRRRTREAATKTAEEMSAQLAALLDRVESQSLRLEQLTEIQNLEFKYRDQIARWPELDRAGVAEHVRRVIAEAELETDPCPYFVVSNLFPQSFYDAVIESLPPPVFFAQHRANKQQLGVPLPLAPRYSRLVWQFMSDVVRDVMGPAIRARLQHDIDQYVATFCPPALEAKNRGTVHYKVSDGRIMLRRAGYEILPHRDPKWGFVTALVYLARPGDPAEFGTELYRVRNDHEAPSENPFYVEADRCELARKVPFAPNTALVFLNSRGAHGARVPPDAPETLERYLYQFRVGPDKESIRTMIGLMSDEARTLWAGGKMNKALDTY